MNRLKAELLAPAGSYDSLRAAVNAGADAVYMGGSDFGARAYADNPDCEKLKEAIDYMHLHGKKLYLTVNTLLKNDEIKSKLYNYLNPLYRQGLDAVIVQDFGVLKFVRECFPKLDIHASTQMTITGKYGAGLMKECGAVRIVTARELSLKEIKAIHESTDIEIESFIHGALCYCYSGQCLLSSMIGGRSGNRGRCAQPCRLPYEITGSDFKNNRNERYIMSPKDMCTIKILPDILEAGVYSLKIEGRMKSPEYVAGVTQIYRKYIDLYLEKGRDGYYVKDEDYKSLTGLYSRNGFSEGYYNTHNGRHMISLSTPSYNSVDTERIEELNNLFVKEDKKIRINIYADIVKDKPIKLKLDCNGTTAESYGNIPELSEKHPATAESVEKQLVKLGNTPFKASKVKINIEDGLFIPIKFLNEVRRNAVLSLTKLITEQYKRDDGVNKEHGVKDSGNICIPDMEVICSVETLEQFHAAADIKEVKSIYISADFIGPDKNALKECIKECHLKGKKCFITLPFILRNNIDMSMAIQPDADGYVVKNIDELGCFRHSEKELTADYSLYSMNDLSSMFLKENGITSLTAPLELNEKELMGRNNSNGEIIIYGYMPLMVTAGCTRKTMNACDGANSTYKLKDRYNKIFLAKTSCKYCYNVLYNCQPLSLLKYASRVKAMGFNRIRLNFTFESAGETKSIINKFVKSYVYNEDTDDIDNCTHGHFRRKVE